MKKLLPFLFAVLVVAPGCGSSEPSAAAEKSFRAKMSQKELDFDSVPVANRAQVIAMMKGNGAAAKAAELEKKWGMTK
ncbi:MAG TPA: hypothetical protein VG944_19200 [Fimbriimonas sp.]|nr:hypothetical protein [Fimbriimonas sp.]